VPGRPRQFFLAPFGLHWSEVRASDFLTVDFDGPIHSGSGPVEDTAFHIHAPIHAARPDVGCVLHTHMPYATALSLLEQPELLMASQNAIGFAGLVASYDYNGFALDNSEGERMARALGDKSVLLLRNHGIVVTGRNTAEAFNTLYFFERAAMAQIIAQSSGLALRIVAQDVLDHTLAQYRTSEKVDGLDRIELHFAALKRMLDRRQRDYAT
jgi:ribulose-5-phosphate 4-epimerase/fuculose-1-phosphate aldolase